MVINWTKSAIVDLKNFNETTKKIHPIKYINELVQYTNNLLDNPRLGKVYSYINENIIRKLVFKDHIIYYYISNDTEIFILAVIHHLENTKNRINYIKAQFN